jgi:2-methylcitrate dehydratase PrpD
MVRRLMKRMAKKMTEQFNDKGNQKRTKREGQVTIEQTDRKEKKVDKNIGDYIDFEEEN